MHIIEPLVKRTYILNLNWWNNITHFSSEIDFWNQILSYLSDSIFFFPLFITGIFICGEAEKVMGQKDPSSVIWDEFVAVPYIFITIPEEISFQDGNSSLIWLLLGFILFRFFDIVKPLGINSLQEVKNGFGVMIDDFLAAAYSALSLLALKTFPLSFFW